MEAERADWILYLTTATEEVCGEPVETYSKSYTEQGWDMIDSVTDTNPLEDDPDNSVIRMFVWNPTSQSYEGIDPFEVVPRQG
ncbi:hypothetical protein GWO43_30610 [candidate division KSB1 bacterium]|nr:hypothetical protein [candidate division KSB1 bacterium]NIR72946.1 hypothetical protein [candidate division KSB1 bacterium]NIS28245.1 hypothetical protein [candidate division KSB1 bacterium]NIT75134.1 hypothetical protein [candidate division KSB1 bacterium]NIU28922.1 hypothetical protein [candidate division KSB1 bacterium]